jgi:hypothetical protein
VDLWWRGINIACDAGTYLYSGEGIWRNGLAHTSAHNTVIVDHQDQMKMVSRFIWTNWAKGKVLRHDEKVWQGQHDGYRRLADPVAHKRTVLSLGEDRWLVVDHLDGKQAHHYSLHWLFCDSEYGVRELSAPQGYAPARFEIKLGLPGSKCRHGATATLPDSKVFIQMGLLNGKGNFSVVRADPESTRGWRSRYYGQKEPAISAMLDTDQPRACFWTYFGLENDKIEIGKTLKISAGDWNVEIDLDELNL